MTNETKKALELLKDDLQTFIDGGKSLFDWAKIIEGDSIKAISKETKND